MIRSFFSVTTWPLASLLVIGFLGSLAGHLSLSREITRLDDVRLQLPEAQLRFEKAVGYGGFIHNFKNFILRGSSNYLHASHEQYALLTQAMDDVERIAAQLDTEIRLDSVRETFAQYRRMLDTAAQAWAEGSGPANIDQLVRVTDAEALAEIRTLRDQLKHLIDDRHETLSSNLIYLQIALFALLLGVTGMMANALRRRSALREQQSLNNELEMLINIAAHDLKSPMRHIKCLVEFLKEDIEEDGTPIPQPALETLDEIENRTDRLISMCNEIMNYIRSGLTKTQHQPVDLNSLIDKINNLIVPTSGKLRFTGPLDVIETSPEDLEIVLRNLVSNAIKHAGRPDPSIIVRASRQGREAILEVEDNGPGIPVQFRDQIFGMFKTLKSSSGDRDVSGVGLAVVSRLVAKLKGRIDIADSPHGGAIISVTLPG